MPIYSENQPNAGGFMSKKGIIECKNWPIAQKTGADSQDRVINL
jgi:hypothetical protein